MSNFKSPLRYPGGKSRACKLLYDMIPDGVDTVISPFLGGGSFELYLINKGYRVIAYDAFKPLTNFWQMLIKYPEALHSMIVPCIGRVDKEIFKSFQNKIIHSKNNTVADATMFYIVNRCSFSGTTLSGGYYQASADTRFTKKIVDRLLDFKDIGNKFEVHNSPMELSLPMYTRNIEYDNAFIFADPPYDIKSNLYGIEGSMHKDFNHQWFRDVMNNIDNIPFLITYNGTEEIRKLWSDYNIEDVNWTYGMNKSKKSSEIVITNYSINVENKETINE